MSLVHFFRGIATRIVVVSWWFFSMIIVSTYMAHLFAFGDLEEVEHSIKDVRELANQQKIKYGCVRGGATCDFFEVTHLDVRSKARYREKAVRPLDLL